MNTLGHRQRRMLIDIAHHGRGHWPRGWVLRFSDAETLSRLHARQLVTAPDTTARLTSAGHLVAASLRGEIS